MDTVRNLTIVGNNASGKTSLAEAMLFVAKATSRLGKVDDGSSHMDFEPEEVKRHISINTAFHRLTWNKITTYLADTPGEDNFLAETKDILPAFDTLLMVVDATDPKKPQLEKIWPLAKSKNKPAVFYINKLDKENVNFQNCIDTLQTLLKTKLIPFFYPIIDKNRLIGIIDILTGSAFRLPTDFTPQAKECEIPAELQDTVNTLRNSMIEYAAESDDVLLEKFLEGNELSFEEITTGLKKGIAKGALNPAYCGAAIHPACATLLLNSLIQLLPSPEDTQPLEGMNPKTQKTVTRKPLTTEPFSAIVIKTTIDPFAGRLSVARILSGTLKHDTNIYNSTKGVEERVGTLLAIEGKEQKTIPAEAGPGEIVAIPKLKETSTGDTLCDSANPILYSYNKPAQPGLTFALKPKTRGDEEKISQVLTKMQEEDPYIAIQRDANTGELLLASNGQLHLDVTLEKMARKYGVHVDISLPSIPYKETIKGSQKGIVYRHKKQTGGAGQFAEVHFDISSLPRGSGFEFEEALVGMNVPRNFVPAVEKGIHEAMQSGPLAGYPVVDVKVRFYDGKSHEVDSSETAFKIAAIQCFKKGVMDAKPTLLEPMVKMTITVPDDYVGDVIGDINSRRGKVMGMDPCPEGQRVTAIAPIAEVQRYLLDLNALTAGRGSFTMEPAHYEEVPAYLIDKIVAKAAEERAKHEK
ncbi:MAG: elongation factor G [Dissulfuribacterales bacterium]